MSAFVVSLIIFILGAAWLKKQGVRRISNGVFGGVCGGIAKHYGWDIMAVRLIAAILALTVGGPLLAYFLLWLILDAEESPNT